MCDEVLVDFPFAEEASRANALALALTVLLRPAIAGHVPMAIVVSPRRGSGKGLLVDAIMIIVTGQTAALLGEPTSMRRADDAEWDKRLTAVLLAGGTAIVVDNVEGVLRAPTLCRLITGHRWQGRRLGQSEMLDFEPRVTVVVTGNNVQLAGDLPRRCYEVNIDPKTPHPELRTGFHHDDLLGWCREHRAELLRDLLVMVRAWYGNVQPKAEDVPVLGSFEESARVIAGILEFAAVEGFLGNQGEFREQHNEGEREWENFLAALRGLYGDQPFTSKDVVADIGRAADNSQADPAKVSPDDGQRLTLRNALPSDLAETHATKPGSLTRRLGWALKKHDGARVGDMAVYATRTNTTRDGVGEWKVRVDNPQASDTEA